MKEIEHQLELGAEGLAEDDRLLLECNFDELVTTTGEQCVASAPWLGACHSAAGTEP